MATIKILNPTEYERYSQLADIPIISIKKSFDDVKNLAKQNGWEIDEVATAEETFNSFKNPLHPTLDSIADSPEFLNVVDKITTLQFGNYGAIRTYLGKQINGTSGIPIKDVLSIILDWLKNEDYSSNTTKASDRLEEAIFWLSK